MTSEPQRGAATSGPSPGLAALLSFILPGLGQVYAGRALRGALWYVASIALVVAAAALIPSFGALWLVALALAVLPHVIAPVDAARVARAGASAGTGRGSALLIVLCALGFFVFGRVAGVAVRALLVESFKIPAASMRPTLDIGDHFFALKTSLIGRAPARGEIVVFEFPENRAQSFVKRVVGLPGDVVELKDGLLQINGKAVSRCEVGPITKDGQDMIVFVEFLGDSPHLVLLDSNPAGFMQGPWTVGPDAFFVMGDNRDNSYDSRAWFGGKGGGVPRDHLIGSAGTIFWSPGAPPDASRSGLDAQALHAEAVPQLASEIAACLKRGPLPPGE